jgi:CheY-like chemotaxis protein
MTVVRKPLRPEQAFLATTSHEIRTPLNGILGTVSLLMETELDAAQKEYARAIHQSGNQLLDLLNNMLDFARLESGAVGMELTPLNAESLAQECAELLAPRCQSSAVDLAVLARPGLPRQLVGDAGRLRQIFFNLIGNALKFTVEGGILVDLDYSDGVLRVRVHDTGPGIEPDQQQRLFEAFHQARPTDQDKGNGVGLGLAIVSRLASLMKGAVRVISVPGAGSCFELTLPMAQVEDPSAGEEVSPKLRGRVALAGLSPATALAVSAPLLEAGASPFVPVTPDRVGTSAADLILASADLPSTTLLALCASAPVLIVLRPEDRMAVPRFRRLGAAGWLVRPLRRETLIQQAGRVMTGRPVLPDQSEVDLHGTGRVLIADDNPVNALIAQRALESAGFQTTMASNGRDALDLMDRVRPGLVLMDLRMPIMDGFEAMRRLRETGHDVPIIAVSAEINPDIERRARACGANGVASKPLDAETLRRLAQRWLPVERTDTAA